MPIYHPETGTYSFQTLPSIGEKLYLNEDFADFQFIFKIKLGNGSIERRIPAHKNLLGIASDVFRVMFNGSWKEKTEVEIVDATFEAFKEFLQFFYLGEARLTAENVVEVLNLGKKYDVTHCFEACGKFLRNNFTDDNIFTLYELAIRFEHKSLERFCETIIGLNTKAIFGSENFLECNRRTVKRILKLDFLTCTETEAFEALLNWIKATIKSSALTWDIVRGRFEDLFQEIRFGSMALDDFLALDSYSHLFSYDEYRENIHSIKSRQHHTKPFKTIARKTFKNMTWGSTVLCGRLLSFNASFTPYFIQDMETTTFSTNEPMLLMKFVCSKVLYWSNGTLQMLNDFSSDITISEIPESGLSGIEQILYSQSIMLQSDNPTIVDLNQPVLIRPGLKYEITMKQSPPPNSCTATLMNSEVHVEPDIIITFHDDPVVGDKAARGTIQTLEFARI